MEVVLSHGDSDAWSCQISLRIMYDVKGILLSESHIVPFGEPLHDSEGVERRLLLAQAAVLQLPFMDEFSVNEFLQDDYEAPAKPPVDFSRNVVRLEVCSPDLVDVTFIDLPGIISNANQVHIFGLLSNFRNGSIQSTNWLVTISHNRIV